MRFPFKPIIIGILFGAAFFFIPFRFPFVFFFILLLFWFRPWGRRRYGWRRDFAAFDDGIISIDGRGNRDFRDYSSGGKQINIQ